MRYTTRIIVPPRVRRSGMPGSIGTGPRPQVIGVRKSLGFGDPLGQATPGHLAVAAAHPEFAPFFAQAAPGEAAASGRTLAESLAVAARAVGAARFRQPWGADADDLRTPQDVDEAAAAGYAHFTIDLSQHVHDDAARLAPDELAAAVDRLIADGELPDDWASPYLDREVSVLDDGPLRLTLEPLQRAAVRLGRAVQHGARMYETVARANRGRPYEIEISLDRSALPISTIEHLYLGLELEARGVRLTGLAFRPRGQDPATLQAALREHIAVASFCGPYKLSFRGEHYDPALLPAIGRTCGDLLHFKTSTETLVEALRLMWRVDLDGLSRVALDHGLTLPDGASPEDADFDRSPHVRPLALACVASEFVRETLALHADMYQELITERFERLILGLNAG